jgi:hypothetical protein
MRDAFLRGISTRRVGEVLELILGSVAELKIFRLYPPSVVVRQTVNPKTYRPDPTGTRTSKTSRPDLGCRPAGRRKRNPNEKG